MKKYLAGLICLALMATLVIKVPVSAASPKLSATKATMYVGDTLKLSVKGAKKVAWSTDKKKVATVTQKGVVKAYAKGNARITAKAGAKKLVCKVTVKAAKLELSAKSVMIGLANPKQSVSAKLNDKAIKASKLKWSSKDAKIATVTNGVIEAKAAGRTTITAAYKKVKATITVEVIDDAEKAITGKGFETKKTTIMVTDSDETLPVQVFFDGADVTSKVTSWVSSDTDVIEFDEGEFTIGDAGQATLTATYQGQTLTFTIIVKEAPEEADTDDEEEEDEEDEDADDEDEEDLSDDSDVDSGDDGVSIDGDDGDDSEDSDDSDE